MSRAMRIIIGYDGSECADRGIKDLERAGIPEGSDVLVLSVAEWFPVPIGVGGSEGIGLEPTESGELAVELARRGAAIVKSTHPTWNVTSEGYTGSPAHEIVRRAEEWGAELIVVGSHGRGAVGRLLLGSVSQQIIHSAHSSVRIARPNDEKSADAPLRLILAVDGSGYSEVILDALLLRSWPTGTVVHILSSAEFSYDSEEEESILTRLTLLHQNISEKLSQSGFEVESTIDTKMMHPKRMILVEAERSNADCIFMGARGLSGFERFILGSISTGVAMQAKCSVEIVHKATE
ncbi:MAG: universal stress protein [Ignavibacteriae bacterium]|nr:universal stress protein [Ignavibacteriota bacterium]MCB9214817.1 universal stress protein [Ignavibacteria bacterium]